MKPKFAPIFGLAAALALSGGMFLSAQYPSDNTDMQSPTAQTDMQNRSTYQDTQNVNSFNANANAQNEAMQMAPALASLDTSLDARKMQPGTQFQATLTETVRLKDGTELPHGTRLIGVVAADSASNAFSGNMSSGGERSALALRFTQAELKDGRAMPITATITDVKPGNEFYPAYAADFAPHPWDNQILNVEDVGVFSGVDLHSQIGAENSGLFVSASKDDVKLVAGTQLELAIATAQG